MVKILAVLVGAAAAASAINVDQLAPAATGYIYRSDNDGPASLIQLGAHAYQQPYLPLLQPQPIQAYDIAAVPLPYIAAKPIVEEDADEDSEEDYLDFGGLGHEHESGEGSNYNEAHHAAHGEKGSSGHSSKGHFEKGSAGHYGKEHEEGSHKESGGEHKSHHDEADAHGKHHEAGESYKGGDHGHKEYHSKGEDVTGFHKVYHKDEFKKDHDFYDVADKSGHFNKHGYQKGHHGSEAGAHKESGHHDSGSEQSEFGKAGSHAEGEYDDAHSGHSAEEGHDSHYNHEADYGKKGGSGHEKEYAYAEDDDEDYE